MGICLNLMHSEDGVFRYLGLTGVTIDINEIQGSTVFFSDLHSFSLFCDSQRFLSL